VHACVNMATTMRMSTFEHSLLHVYMHKHAGVMHAVRTSALQREAQKLTCLEELLCSLQLAHLAT
jgi:hypothetical protein